MEVQCLPVRVSTRKEFYRFSEMEFDIRTQTCPTSLPDIRQAGGRRVCVTCIEIIFLPIPLSEPRPFPATRLVLSDQASPRISFCQNGALAF